MKRKVSKRLLLRLEGSNLSIGTLNNKDYVVCPCVALVGNNVIWASDSPYPEYVPVETLKASVDSWNFRPVVLTHPANEDGEYYPTANTPEVLESFWFGYVFNSRVMKGKLFFDLWLDEERAEKVDAGNVISRLRSGDVVEVSIGCDVLVEEEEGEVNGQYYNGVWKYIAPDHLATLPEDIGACSIEMGCGAGRRARQRNHKGGDNTMRWMKRISAKRVLAFARKKPTSRKAALRLLEILDPTQSPSYSNMYQQLDKALRKITPQFGYVLDFWPDLSVVVYGVYDGDEYYSPTTYYRRDYKVRKGLITLGEDVREVVHADVFKDKVETESRAAKETVNKSVLKGVNQSKQAAKYINVKSVKPAKKPVKAVSKETPCGCQKKGKKMEKKKVKATVKKRVAQSTPPPKKKVATRSTLLKRLGQHVNVDALAPLSTPALRRLWSGFKADGGSGVDPKKVVAKKKATATPSTSSNVRSLKQPTTEEWLRSAPKEVRLMFKRHENLEAKYRGKLITSLLKDQSIYKQKQLEKMETIELEKIRKLATDISGKESVDFSARGLAVNYGDVEVDEYGDEDGEGPEMVDPLSDLIGKRG